MLVAGSGRVVASGGAMQRLMVTASLLSLVTTCTGGTTPSRPTGPSATRGTTPGTPSAPMGWSTYVDRTAGFSIAYPPGWHLDPIHSGCATVGFDGASVSNILPPPDQTGCSTWPANMTATPATGVVIVTDLFSGGPVVEGQRLLPDTPKVHINKHSP